MAKWTFLTIVKSRALQLAKVLLTFFGYSGIQYNTMRSVKFPALKEIKLIWILQQEVKWAFVTVVQS